MNAQYAEFKRLLENPDFNIDSAIWHKVVSNQLMDLSDEELVDLTKKCLMFCSFTLCGMSPTNNASYELAMAGFDDVIRSLTKGLRS